MLKVGSLQNGTDVFLSDKSPNRHISVLGISGSGKTVRLRELIRNVVENGETALMPVVIGTYPKRRKSVIREKKFEIDAEMQKVLDQF